MSRPFNTPALDAWHRRGNVLTDPLWPVACWEMAAIQAQSAGQVGRVATCLDRAWEILSDELWAAVAYVEGKPPLPAAIAEPILVAYGIIRDPNPRPARKLSLAGPTRNPRWGGPPRKDSA